MLEGPCADSEEKHEPASDADAAVVDSLKALDLNRPIREADIAKRQLLEKCYDLATAFAIKTPIKESRAAECKSAG